MNRKIFPLLITIFAACSILAACSSGGGTTDSGASKPTASAPSASAPAGKPSAAAPYTSAVPSAGARSSASVSPKATPSATPSGPSAAVDPDAALKKLLVGTWETTEGGTLKFDQNGTLTVTAPDKTVTTSSYSIKGLEETSMKISVTNSDGTRNSENALFTDNNTLVIGDAVFTRVS